MNKTGKVPVTGTTRPLLKYECIPWFIVWPPELEPERILARQRVLSSVPLFLLTLTTGAPPAGELLQPSQMFPAGAVVADRSGESWREGFWVCAARPGPTKLQVLIVAVLKAAEKGLLSGDEAHAAIAELGAMEELQ